MTNGGHPHATKPVGKKAAGKKAKPKEAADKSKKWTANNLTKK